MLGNLAVFCILVSVIFKCQACGASILTRNAEGPLNMLNVNQRFQGAVGNQRNTPHGTSLFRRYDRDIMDIMRRYHGPGTDFAVRESPHFSGQGDLNNENMEVNNLLNYT